MLDIYCDVFPRVTLEGLVSSRSILSTAKSSSDGPAASRWENEGGVLAIEVAKDLDTSFIELDWAQRAREAARQACMMVEWRECEWIEAQS